jgi:hypothetical protein
MVVDICHQGVTADCVDSSVVKVLGRGSRETPLRETPCLQCESLLVLQEPTQCRDKAQLAYESTEQDHAPMTCAEILS